MAIEAADSSILTLWVAEDPQSKKVLEIARKVAAASSTVIPLACTLRNTSVASSGAIAPLRTFS